MSTSPILTVKRGSGWNPESSWQHRPASHRRRFAVRSASSSGISRRFVMIGPGTSVAEVTNVSRHGFWLLLDAEELLVPFASFPWF